MVRPTTLTPDTVLVVDDEPDICGELALFLSHLEYKVITAQDGREGLRLFSLHLPVVTITDYRMPGMDGLALLHEIKRLEPHAQVIFMSGHADMKVALQAIKDHAFDFLPKPLDLVELREKVAASVEQWERSKTPPPTSSSYLVGHELREEPRPVSILHFLVDLDELSKVKVYNAFQHYLLEGVLAPRVVLSLNKVSRINNMGLNLLLDVHSDLKEARKRAVMTQVNQSVMNYLRVLGYHEYFSIHQALENAIASV